VPEIVGGTGRSAGFGPREKWGAAAGGMAGAGVGGAAAICSGSVTGCGPAGCDASRRATAGPLGTADEWGALETDPGGGRELDPPVPRGIVPSSKGGRVSSRAQRASKSWGLNRGRCESTGVGREVESPPLRDGPAASVNSCPHRLQRGGLPARLITGRTSLWQWLHHMGGHLLESIPGGLPGPLHRAGPAITGPANRSGGGATEGPNYYESTVYRKTECEGGPWPAVVGHAEGAARRGVGGTRAPVRERSISCRCLEGMGALGLAWGWGMAWLVPHS